MASFTTLVSTVAPLTARDVDTDQIIPARFLKVTTKDGLGQALFADWRYHEDGSPRADFVLNRPEHAAAQILLAGENFGCGSSREHASWALLGHGFRAVLAPSFADIFRNNALKNGVLPVVLPEDFHRRLCAAAAADPTLRVEVDLQAEVVRAPGVGEASFAVDAFARRCLLDGVDELGYLLAHAARIAEYEAQTARDSQDR